MLRFDEDAQLFGAADAGRNVATDVDIGQCLTPTVAAAVGTVVALVAGGAAPICLKEEFILQSLRSCNTLSFSKQQYFSRFFPFLKATIFPLSFFSPLVTKMYVLKMKYTVLQECVQCIQSTIGC